MQPPEATGFLQFEGLKIYAKNMQISMPIYAATFPQDFSKLISQQGPPAPPPPPIL